MMDANEMRETIMRELNKLIISDTDEGETKEEEENFSLNEEEASDEIPASLLSYFETSKSRAAVCEKLILEEVEDLIASHHAEDVKLEDLPTALNKDTMTLNEPVLCGTENEENNTFTDTRLLPAPTETETLVTHNVSVCYNKDDEAGKDEYTEYEQHLALEVMTLKISVNEEERKRSNEYEVEPEKHHCQEMKEEEQRRQREQDFQDELKKIMEAEKLQQKELELMAKRAQEKLEEEMLLQQELISNLQRRVAEERRIKKEEQKKMKEEKEKKKEEEEERSKWEEENRKKWEEVKSKMETERKRMEEEMRRKKQEVEKRKVEEIRIKEEEERRKKQQEEERKKREEKEENKKKEAERHKIELDKKKLEDEMRRMKDEEERKNVETAKRKFEEENNGKMEEEMRLRLDEEEWRKKEKEERKRREEKNERTEEAVTIKEVEKEVTRKEKKKDDRKKIEAERKIYMKEEKKETEEVKRTEEEERQLKEEKRTKEEDEKKNNERKAKKEEMRKQEEEMRRQREEEMRRQREEEMRRQREDEMRRQREEEMRRQREEEMRRQREEEMRRQREEEMRRQREEEMRRQREEEMRRQREEEMRRQREEEMRRQREEEDYRITQEEMRLKEEQGGIKKYEAGNRKMEPERKNRHKEKKQEEEGDGRKNIVEEKRQIEKEVRENKEEHLKTEERRFKDEDESTNIIKKDTLMRENELQEMKRERNSRKIQNERENRENTQLEDRTTQTSSSPGLLHAETVQQHDLNKNISQSSVYETTVREDPVVKTSTSSGSSVLCLPEHTEQKRLSWMKDCIPWSKLSLQNRRKQRGSARSWRGPRRVVEASSLPPLCPDTLLQSTRWKSLQEVTTVALEDLPGCSLSTLAQCRQLRSLTLRRCGLKALESVNQLPELCYIDVQENNISSVDCENMTSLRVLRLGHNMLTSIHGLSGVENLDVLDLSHNSITRIAGLESMRRLQRLSVDHNQLISTKGLREVYTLLHLDCSHNHLVSVEGLENSALLNTLDLTANSLAEPPSLNNQVLLRELRLDDNSISSLQGLTACWLPLMQILSVAQNRITQLPSMSDFVSLSNVDLRFNCLSDLKNICESLEGCPLLQEVHLMGNPLEQESGWRSTLQKAVPALRTIDGQQTDSRLSSTAVQQVSLASGSFLMFCQAQLQQTRDLQQQHGEELSHASFPLDSVKTSCQHFTKALQLAEDQRFAHEYGDTTAADKQRRAGQTTPEKTLDEDISSTGKLNEHPEMEFTGKVSTLISRKDNIRSSYWTFGKNLATESQQHDTLDNITAGPSASLKTAAVSNHQDLELKNTSAVVIQQQWRKYRQICRNISSPPTAENGAGKGGDGGKPESGPIKWNISGQDHAATVIQAFWRGFTLRRRLTSALAAVTCPNSGEDDIFEEVDMDGFVFDEPPGHFPEPQQYVPPPPPVWRPKQAWVSREQVDSVGQRVSPESFDGGFTDSHTALLMLKRAQKMKSKKQQQKKRLVVECGCSEKVTSPPLCSKKQ
ncbi:hypothetical protein PAMA_019791 [Pampus argenteus]